MAVILSRKGIDSGCGAMYSPLNGETGEYAFIPRPESEKSIVDSYTGIDYQKLPTNFMEFKNLFEIVEEKGRIPKYGAHLDPDLINVLSIAHWKPIFGQKGPAQGYLRNRGIGMGSIGSLFLFYSRFQTWNKQNNSLTEGYYIYGWLEVGETIIPSNDMEEYSYHPHFQNYYQNDKNNILYVASENLSGTDLPGAGMFKKLSNSLRLSHNNLKNLLTFKLPNCASGSFSRLKNYRKLDNEFCLADWPQSYGQEAVCSEQTTTSDKVRKTKAWATDLILKNTKDLGLKESVL